MCEQDTHSGVGEESRRRADRSTSGNVHTHAPTHTNDIIRICTVLTLVFGLV